MLSVSEKNGIDLLEEKDETKNLEGQKQECGGLWRNL